MVCFMFEVEVVRLVILYVVDLFVDLCVVYDCY